MVFVRLYVVKGLIHLSVRAFVQKVLLRVVSVTIIAYAIPTAICVLQPDSVLRLLEICVVSLISSLLTVYFVGLSDLERNYAKDIIMKKCPLIK